jgi:hypothetical protein
MRHSLAFTLALRRFLPVAAALAGLVSTLPRQVLAETVVPVAAFRSVTLRGGGHVILRHAPKHRVTILEGSTSHTSAAIADGDRLVIDRCQTKCPRGYKMTVEVLTPDIADVRVNDGGVIQTIGSFPDRGALRVMVDSGGLIDLRSMTIDSVAAAIRQGGRIFVDPGKSLVARIEQGGAVTYWGDPRVNSSIDHGGVVVKGDPADFDKPVEELGPAVASPPPVPPVPPVPPTRVRGTL